MKLHPRVFSAEQVRVALAIANHASTAYQVCRDGGRLMAVWSGHPLVELGGAPLPIDQTNPYGRFIIRYPASIGSPAHVDPAPAGYDHQRLIVLLQECEAGGELTIGGMIVPLSPGDGVLFRADLEEHGVSPVLRGERIVLTLGKRVLLPAPAPPTDAELGFG